MVRLLQRALRGDWKMTQSEFIKEYCKNSNLTEEELGKIGLFAVPCDCGEDNCKGWAMVTKLTLLNHVNLYIKKGLEDDK